MNWKLWKKNKSQDLVTVFLPTFNNEKWLKESIESILSQTYRNIELIIVDDSTTDRIKKIVDTYLNKGNVRYFHRENITGLASAHNFCIDHMNGDWLKIMSSDDILLPDAIENFVKYAHSKKSKILYPDVQYINEIGNSIGTRIQQEFDNPEKLEEYLWLYQIIISVSLFYHKSCFDTVGKFDETLIETFDYKWISQATVLHNCRFTHIPKILFKFRLHKKQTSFEHSKQHLSDVSKIRHSILNELLKKNPEKWNLFQKRISNSKFK